MPLTRRHFLATAAAATLPAAAGAQVASPRYSVPRYDVPRALLPRIVATPASVPPGHVHVYPGEFALYLAGVNGRSFRYTVGIGAPSLYTPGRFTVGARREFPGWMPTPGMIRRQPELYAQYEGVGIPPGLENPLGARALYLHDARGRDTYLRIHGTHRLGRIGNRESNGCVNLINDQAVHLYDRVALGTPVTLHPEGAVAPGARA